MRPFLVFLLFSLPVIWQGWEASQDLFLMPAQLMKRAVMRGLPFIAHGGMWADIFVFAPLMGYIVTAHGNEWRLGYILLMGVVGFALSFALHYLVYVPSGKNFPEAHTHYGWLTRAGKIHLWYMAAGLAVVGLFYFFSSISEKEVAWVSSLLFVHAVIGTHVPLKVLARCTPIEWYPKGPVLGVTTAATLTGTALLLAGFSWWALYTR